MEAWLKRGEKRKRDSPVEGISYANSLCRLILLMICFSTNSVGPERMFFASK
eukprot:TRINITY_DN10589_c0_g1_i1.p1 TRINITY_DN10589_c0_g1~~TRINITY_DN10589_c0_g1_i1.p1  ORF type:complete len:52 (-),score=4.48 TRINITY_DN10589_c0_g1_i1:23-178(-)